MKERESRVEERYVQRCLLSRGETQQQALRLSAYFLRFRAFSCVLRPSPCATSKVVLWWCSLGPVMVLAGELLWSMLRGNPGILFSSSFPLFLLILLHRSYSSLLLLHNKLFFFSPFYSLFLYLLSRLVLAGRSQEKLFEVQDLCIKQGCEKCCIYPLDVAKQDDCRYVYKFISRKRAGGKRGK